MRIDVVLALALSFGSSASAKDINCQIDKAVMGGGKAEVPVSVVRGAVIVDDKNVTFEGSTVSAKYQLGDQFESQTYLQLKFDDMVSTTYNVSESSLYHLTKADLRFQCWFE
jgi:hypothetical protein